MLHSLHLVSLFLMMSLLKSQSKRLWAQENISSHRTYRAYLNPCNRRNLSSLPGDPSASVHIDFWCPKRKRGFWLLLRLTRGSPGTFPVVQWLKICLPVKGVQVSSLVEELTSHMLEGNYWTCKLQPERSPCTTTMTWRIHKTNKYYFKTEISST